MTLFEATRIESAHRSILPGESLFHFYSHSPEPEAVACRSAIQSALNSLPPACRERFYQRLRSNDDSAHTGALFELALVAHLPRYGLMVEGVPHAHEESQPDMFVIDGRGVQCAVEATVIQYDPRLELSRGLIDTLLHSIAMQFEVRDWKMHLLIEEPSVRPIAPRRFVGFLRRLSDSLYEPDEVGSERAKVEAVFCDDSSGWRLAVTLFRTAGSIEASRAISASVSYGMHQITVSERIAKSIKEKKRQHRSLRCPLLIAFAIQGREDFCTDLVEDALFGPTATRYLPNSDWHPEPIRTPDGVWHRRRHPQSIRPHAVLSTSNISLWSFPRLKLVLWPNPWLANLESIAGWTGPRTDVDPGTGKIEYSGM